MKQIQRHNLHKVLMFIGWSHTSIYMYKKQFKTNKRTLKLYRKIWDMVYVQ